MTFFFPTCDMTHSYATRLIRVRRDSFMCDMLHSYATWLIHMQHDSFMHVQQAREDTDGQICDMTLFFSRATWLIHTRHDSFIRDMTHSCAT